MLNGLVSRRALPARLPMICWVVLGAGAVLAGPPVAQAADPCPNATIRAAQNADFLGDCRAYERVSPADKSGGNVFWPNDLSLGSALAGVTAASADGQRLMYMSYQAFPGAIDAFLHSYRSTRGTDGWDTSDLTPTGDGRPSLVLEHGCAAGGR